MTAALHCHTRVRRRPGEHVWVVVDGTCGGVVARCNCCMVRLNWGFRVGRNGDGVMDPSRRNVLKAGGLGLLGAAGMAGLPWGSGTLGARSASELAESRMPLPFRAGLVRPPVLRPYKSLRNRDGVWTDHFSLTERAGRAAMAPGLNPLVYTYNATVPGPEVRRGRRPVVRVRNKLPDVHAGFGQESTTSLHLHGSSPSSERTKPYGCSSSSHRTVGGTGCTATT